LNGNTKAGLMNTLLKDYMTQPFVSELKSGHGMSKVAMREANNRDCAGVWFLAMSDKHSSEDMSKSINEHLISVRGKIKKIT
jgi:hypothetical protein